MFLNPRLDTESGETNFARGHCQHRTLEYHRNECDCRLCMSDYSPARAPVSLPNNTYPQDPSRMVQTEIFGFPKKLPHWYSCQRGPIR